MIKVRYWNKKVVSGIKCDVLIHKLHVVEVKITVLPRTRLPTETAKCKSWKNKKI